MAELRHTRRPAAGVMLECLEAGPPDGPLVLLLHGFPDFAWSWTAQIEALARAGFHAVAPDQRGYGRSDKPKATAAYRLDVLAKDVVELARGIGRDRFDLVGHDWGGAVGWWTAASYPAQVRRLAILNAPHPAAMRRYIRRTPSQRLRSAYMDLFQVRGLAEAVLGAFDFKVLAGVLERSSRPGAFSPADMARYRRGWDEPGALTAMLNWYRAARLASFTPPSIRIAAPTLVVWGEKDPFLERGLAVASLELCADARAIWFEQATHWLQHEEPDAISAALVEFLSAETMSAVAAQP